MTTTNRELLICNSNNDDNPNKNLCCLEVCKFLNVHENVLYLHTLDDVLRATRKQYKVRSRLSTLSNKTLLAASKKCQVLTEKESNKKVIGYLVTTPRHVLLLSDRGHVLVDTGKTSIDTTVDGFYIIYK